MYLIYFSVNIIILSRYSNFLFKNYFLPIPNELLKK